MKALILGIDGGDHNILTNVPAPYLHKLFDRFTTVELTEDLLSRGWVEILSGCYARDTKAFYMMPKLDGTNEFIFRFSMNEFLSNLEVVPIWKLVTRHNGKVGIMNVPTTFPAQSVEGFFISGAGGGVNKVEGIPPDLCYPQELAKSLDELGYIIDLRVGTAGIKDIQLLFDKLNLMLEKRVEAFIKLCRQYQPDFGFLATRATTSIQYLAMSELEIYFAYRRGELSTEEAKKHEIWFGNFEQHYRLLDRLLKQVVEELNPEHCLITSDHGIVPYRYKANANKFLRRYGYQKTKLLVMPTIKNTIRSIIKRQSLRPRHQVDWATTKAFGNWYVSGIYINDAKRFNNAVAEAEIDELVDKICADFNQTEEAKQYKMIAKPYRRLYLDAKYHDYLPDIKIHCPDTIFFAPDEDAFIKPNEDYAPLPDLNNVKGGMHSGQKGRYPLFCCDRKTAALIREDDPKDLTLVYKLIERIFA